MQTDSIQQAKNINRKCRISKIKKDYKLAATIIFNYDIRHIPGTKDIPRNSTAGGRLFTVWGLVIVTGILKSGPRHGDLQSNP